MNLRPSLLLAAAFAPLMALGAAAQDRGPAHTPALNWTSLPGGTWASMALLPDWQGVWQPFRVPGEAGAPTTRTPVKLKPSVQVKFDIIKKIDETGGDKPTRNLHCVTRGFPGDMGSAETTMQFGYTPGQIMMTFVDGGVVRHIYTDGRPHIGKDDLIDTFQGDSIGHWDGNTLVVDTIGLDPGNEFISGFAQGANSHGVERIALAEPDVLSIETLFEAPEVLTKPMTYTTRYRRHRDWQMIEFDCAQNNADLDPLSGKQVFPQPPK